jgi:hypothetical protein
MFFWTQGLCHVDSTWRIPNKETKRHFQLIMLSDAMQDSTKNVMVELLVAHLIFALSDLAKLDTSALAYTLTAFLPPYVFGPGMT